MDTKPTWCPERGPAIIDEQLARIQRIEKEFTGRNSAIVTRLNQAREYYSRLKAVMEDRRE